MKVCSKCNGPRVMFTRKSGVTEWRCNPCNAKRASDWYYRNHDKAKKVQRDYVARNPKRAKENYLKRNYGISAATFEQMLRDQNYSCFICGTHQNQLTKGLAMDHNHETGNVRKLLCSCCNTALGQVKDSPLLLRKLADYVEMFK